MPSNAALDSGWSDWDGSSSGATPGLDTPQDQTGPVFEWGWGVAIAELASLMQLVHKSLNGKDVWELNSRDYALRLGDDGSPQLSQKSLAGGEWREFVFGATSQEYASAPEFHAFRQDVPVLVDAIAMELRGFAYEASSAWKVIRGLAVRSESNDVAATAREVISQLDAVTDSLIGLSSKSDDNSRVQVSSSSSEVLKQVESLAESATQLVPQIEQLGTSILDLLRDDLSAAAPGWSVKLRNRRYQVDGEHRLLGPRGTGWFALGSPDNLPEGVSAATLAEIKNVVADLPPLKGALQRDSGPREMLLAIDEVLQSVDRSADPGGPRLA